MNNQVSLLYRIKGTRWGPFHLLRLFLFFLFLLFFLIICFHFNLINRQDVGRSDMTITTSLLPLLITTPLLRRGIETKLLERKAIG